MSALEGMRVLDMTQYEAGTSCTQALAFLGADVVKIERPGGGDPGRVVQTGRDHSPYFLVWNSNKRSVTIDLDSEAGRDILLRLVPNFDVFVENYGPGVVEKLKIGYEVLSAINPRIIYGRIKGFGTTGPYAGFKCFDMIAQAMGGGFSVTGEAEGPPMRPGPTIGDAGTGVQMALAITAAYVQQQRTGKGQEIDLAMQEAYTYYMRTVLATGGDYERTPAGRRGNEGGAPTDLYPCTPFGSNDWVYIMVVTTRMWDSLCVAIERADLLADPRFERGRLRVENREALYAEISGWTRERTKQEVHEVLGAAGVPCGYVADTTDFWKDRHMRERELIQTVHHAEVGDVDLLRFPPLMSESRVPMVAAPLLGEHTTDVLQAELGMAEEELSALRSAGVIFDAASPEGAEMEADSAAEPQAAR
jgi:formyl-CoA transferase